MDHVIRAPHQLQTLLKGFIATSGHNQRQIAEKLGISAQAVSKALKHPENMSVQSLLRLLAALNVELALRRPEASPERAAKSEW